MGIQPMNCINNRNVPKTTTTIHQPETRGVPPVAEDKRQAHEGFVRFVAGMIQRAAARIMTVAQRVFNKLFGWVSVLKPTARTSNPVEQTWQPSTPQGETVHRANDNRVKPKQSTSVQEFIQNFESMKKKSMKKRRKTVSSPETNVSKQEKPAALKRPVLERTKSIHRAQPLPVKAVLGRTNSIHRVERLNLGEEEASQENQIPVASPVQSVSKPWNELSEQEKNRLVISHSLRCLREKEAFSTEGIFRIPGRNERSEELMTGLLKGKMIPENADVHDAASAFKKFVMKRFKILPEERLVGIEGSVDKTEAWKNLVDELDEDTKAAFEQIIRLLVEIAEKSSRNKMKAESLAISPGTAFVKSSSNPTVSSNFEEMQKMLRAAEASKKAIKFLIENHEVIFSA